MTHPTPHTSVELDFIAHSTPFDHLEGVYQGFINQFRSFLHRQLLFHAFFLLLLLGEAAIALANFRGADGELLAPLAALTCFTLLTWVLLNSYRKANRLQQLLRLFSSFIEANYAFMRYHKGTADHHIGMATSCYKLSNHLKGIEGAIYSSLGRVSILSNFAELIATKLHGYDLFVMREIAIKRRIEEHRQLVILEPVSLEVHTALAGSYVDLSLLYSSGEKKCRWVEQRHYCREEFRRAVANATEEFRILESLAKDDPWVYSQLAYSYRDLNMPEEELRQYQKLFALRPNDSEIALTLGKLYFKRGQNAKGLEVYERLRALDAAAAKALILHYGCAG